MVDLIRTLLPSIGVSTSSPSNLAKCAVCQCQPPDAPPPPSTPPLPLDTSNNHLLPRYHQHHHQQHHHTQPPPAPHREQPGLMARSGNRNRGASLFALTTLLLFVLWYRQRTPPEPIQLVEPLTDLDALCDPFAEPGFLHYDADNPRAARWIPYSASCEPAQDWLSLFASRDVEALSFLANRTILILGDSVDRNGLEHLAVMLGLPRYCVPYDDFSKKGQVPPGWDERGIPWVVEVPWLGLTFTNGFMYGLDDEDNFRQQPDWHPPGQAEERIDKLFKAHTDELPFPPSFISVHSGLWDLAFFGRQDRVHKLSTEIPLTHERIKWWQKRMTNLLGHIEETWPGVPIWMRKLHRVGPVGGASYDWRHTGTSDPGAPERFSNFFTNVRIHQIREMQEQVSVEVGVPAFDFGEIWEGWQSHQQMVHPLLYPGGPVYAQALIHHIWMESVGRDKWRLTRRRKLAPIREVPKPGETTVVV